MSHAFSAAVKLADLDDFLSPAQSCILPLLDSKGSRQNVVDSYGDHSVAAVAHSSTTAREASVRPFVSHPAGHGRTRKTTRHAAKQEVTRLSSFCSAATEASSAASTAALPDGAGLTITADVADTVSGTASQHVFSGNVSFSEENSGEQGVSVAKGGYASSSTYTRSSLIKLGQSRVLKENTSDSLNSSPPGGAECSKKTNSNSTSAAFSSEISPGPPAFTSAAGQGTKQVARVALYDCLACKGCVTSSEAILIERHSIDEFLRRTGAAISSPSATATREKESGYPADSISATISGATTAPTVASAGDKITNTAEDRKKSQREAQRPAGFARNVSAAAETQDSNDVPPRLVVVSISPQSLTALQQHFHMKSAPVTLRKLSSLFRLAGATHVLHTAVGDALSVLEVEREFINRCREAGIGRRKDAVIRETKGAPAAGLRGETHQRVASETATAAESQIRKGVEAAGVPAAEQEAARVAVAGVAVAGVAVAGVAVAGVALAGVAAAGVAAGEEGESCLMPGTTAGRAPGQMPEERAAARDLAGPYSTQDHSKGGRSCWCGADRSSDVKKHRRREDGKGRYAEFSVGVSASAAAVSDAQPQQHQKGERPQEQQQQHQEEQERNQQRQQDEQQQHDEQEQQIKQQQQTEQQQQQSQQQRPQNQLQSQLQQQQEVQQQDRQKGYGEVSSVPFPSEEKAAESPVLPLLASFCPGFVCYAETSYDAPLLLQHMSRVRSGQQIQGILVKGLLLELHNAASFLLRSVALTAAFSGTGLSPLLLQLLVRKSAYASPRCLEAAPTLQGSAGEGGKHEDTTDPSSARDAHSTAAVVPRPGAAGAACQISHLREKLNDMLQHERWRQHGAANSSMRNIYSDFLSLEGRSLGEEENIRPEDVFHVCVMPCFDKKLEAARPEFRHPTSRAVAASMAAASAAAAASALTGAAAPASGHRREPVDLASEVKEGELASPDSSRRNKSSGSGIQDDVTVADVDLVLATNEVPVLLQRMNVLFEDLPESHVDTLLDDFFPLRSRIACVDLSSDSAAATAGGGAPGTGAVDRRNKKEEATTSSWSSKNAVASASSDVAREKAALICSSYVERMSNFGYISSAVSLFPRLRSLVLSPFQILLHTAAALTPYLSLHSRWRWCRTCSFDNAIGSATRLVGEEEEEDSAAAATAARVATIRERPLAVFNTNAALPSQSTNANVLETLHATFVERKSPGFTGNVKVHDNCNKSQAAASGCFISTEQVCGSGGYAERVFRRAAKELFSVNVEGPLSFQKRKKGDEGYKEAVLVVDGEEKLRVALVYGFKNIQNVVQKLKRLRRLATQPPAAAFAAPEQRDMQMQSKKKQQAQRQQEERKQQEERQRTLRSLPHFLEFAACPGGCLCGGGQKLEPFEKQNASSSFCTAVASSSVLGGVSSSTASTSTLRKGNNVERIQDASEAAAQQQREELALESNNVIFSGRMNRGNISVDEKEISPSSGKCINYRASTHMSPAVPAAPSAAGEQKWAPGTGQAKALETLTKSLHDSHVYCDPLQRVEVQLAYLYLLRCAEDADNKRQPGQRTAEREANTRQKQQQQLRQHTQMQQEQQPGLFRELIDKEGNLRFYKKTLQQQQNGGEDDQEKLIRWQEAQEQQQRHKDQPQQHEWRKKVRETKCDVHRDGIIAGKETTDMAGIHAASLYLSAAGTTTTGKSSGCVRIDRLTCFSPLVCGEKTLFKSPFTSIRCGSREYSATCDTVTATAAETAGATSTNSTVVSQATNAVERASTKATGVAHTPPASAWWNAFGENRTAVKLLRTRFRNIWGGKKEQPQKGDAAVSDVNFSSPPAQHRAAGAKPSLYW